MLESRRTDRTDPEAPIDLIHAGDAATSPRGDLRSERRGGGEEAASSYRRDEALGWRGGLVGEKLEMKEGLAILNGTHLMAGFGALLVDEAERLARLADVCGSMSLEALMGTNAAFDWRVHAIRPHPGQIAVAANLRALTRGSAIIDSHRDCARVQDAYSLRCMPQVHGAAREGHPVRARDHHARDQQRHRQPADLRRRRPRAVRRQLSRPATRARARHARDRPDPACGHRRAAGSIVSSTHSPTRTCRPSSRPAAGCTRGT